MLPTAVLEAAGGRITDTPVSPEVSVHGSGPAWAEAGQRLFGIFHEGCRE